MFVSACTFVVVFTIVALISTLFVYDSFHLISLEATGDASIQSRQASGAENCGFVGNSDLYGVGIRVGYYTQALAAWFANFFVLSEAKPLRPTNILFLLAMFIALIWISHAPSQTYAIEAFLLLQLLLTIWFVAAKEKSKWSAKYWTFHPSQTITREAVAIGILIYNLWFWWSGLDLFQKTPCGTSILFLVVKIGLYGWYRSGHKVLSIVSLCFQTFLTLGHVAQLVDHWRSRQIRTAECFDRLTDSLLQEFLTTSGSRNIHALGTAQKQPILQKNIRYRDQASSPILGYSNGDLRESSSKNSPLFKEPKDTANADLETHPNPSAQRQEPPGKTVPPKQPPQPVPTTSPQQPPLPSLAALRIASTYLSSILLPPPTYPPIVALSIPYTPITLTIPSPYSLIDYPSPQKLLTTPLRPSLLTPLFTHIYCLRTYQTTQYPLFLSRALSSPHHTVLEPSTLSTYLLLLRVHTLPTYNRKIYTLPTAAFTLLITIGLILSIELGIFWNSIQGVRSLGAVGQLVPLVLGLGGLAKVGWTWGKNMTSALEIAGAKAGGGAGGEEMEEKSEWMEAVERCANVYFSCEENCAIARLPGKAHV